MATRTPKGLVRYAGKRGVVWRIKYRDAEGRQVMETVGPDRAEAMALLEERRVNVRKGYRRPAPRTFSAAFGEWFDDPSVSNDWRRSTRSQYVCIRLRLEQSFGPVRLEQLRPSDVVAYRTHMLDEGFAAASVARDLAILHSFLDWATMKEYVPRNVSDGVPYPKAAQREGTPLTPAQVQRLLPAFDDEQARVYFLLLVLSGMRRAEAQSLRWADVDQVDMLLRIRVSKTRTGVRSIAIVPALADALAEHRNRSSYQGDGELVFCKPETGSKYRAVVFKQALERACSRARVELPDGFRPQHDLRVTSITSDAIAGATPTALKSKAGHSSMATTERYVKLAGVVFRSEATAQAARLLGPSTNLLPDSPDLTAPSVTGAA